MERTRLRKVVGKTGTIVARGWISTVMIAGRDSGGRLRATPSPYGRLESVTLTLPVVPNIGRHFAR